MKSFIVALACIVFSFKALANKSESESQLQAYTSYDSRVKNRYLAFFDLPYGGNVYGVGIGFQLMPSLTLETTYHRYEQTYLATETHPEEKYDGYFFSQNLRAFFSNSGNVLMGVMNRNGFGPDDSFRSIGINLAVGNRWQWESGFILGFEWLSIYKPFHYFERTAPLSVNLTHLSESQIQSPLTLLKINLGYAF